MAKVEVRDEAGNLVGTVDTLRHAGMDRTIRIAEDVLKLVVQADNAIPYESLPYEFRRLYPNPIPAATEGGVDDLDR